MSCSFCFVDRTAPDFAGDGLRANIDEMAAAGGKHLVLSGGEPTLHPELPRLLAHGKSLGFEVIEIQTNGVKCADRAYTEKLVEAGLTKATMSLHSHRPEHSDRITRLPNAFGKTIRAIHHFRELGVETQIAHVITKANYEDLPAFVRFLRSEFPRGGRGLSICFAIAQGISDLVYGWVVPTFTEVKPFFREALDFCLENELGFGGMIGQGGYPPCMLDGDLRYYRENLRNVFVSDDWDSQFHKSPRCRECSFDPYCVGPRKSYVETYGDGEIRPFEASIEGAVPLPAPKLVTLRRKDGGADAPATGDG
jgi:MoaA/NifB/PqqE/SkfB family radical SAM enzyme